MPTVKELRAECKEKGIKGYSKMAKDDLLKALGHETTLSGTETEKVEEPKKEELKMSDDLKLKLVKWLFGKVFAKDWNEELPETVACKIGEDIRIEFKKNEMKKFIRAYGGVLPNGIHLALVEQEDHGLAPWASRLRRLGFKVAHLFVDRLQTAMLIENLAGEILVFKGGPDLEQRVKEVIKDDLAARIAEVMEW